MSHLMLQCLKLSFISLFLLVSSLAQATVISGVVNKYVKGKGEVARGDTQITVSGFIKPSAHVFKNGQTLLLIQSQGAQIDTTNTDRYGNGVGTGNDPSKVETSPHGSVDYAGGVISQIAGRFEYAYVDAVIPGAPAGEINLRLQAPLKNSFSDAAEANWQVVIVPDYGISGVTLIGNVSALAWDGDVGGIVAFSATGGDIDFAGFTVDAQAKGFRGGVESDNDLTLDDIASVVSDGRNGEGGKGEGIAGTPKYVFDGTGSDYGVNASDLGLDASQSYGGKTIRTWTAVKGVKKNSNTRLEGGNYGRGAPGNAGGGAGPHNSGGGGGSNAGIGGNGAQGWVGGTAKYYAGYGGQSIYAGLNMGGGGGSGEANNAAFAHGGVGGGIVLIKAESASGIGEINVNGGAGFDDDFTPGDGAGGGGAAGTAILYFEDSAADYSQITVNAIGGAGAEGDPDHGSGGGGGGGYVVSNVLLDSQITSMGGAGGANKGVNGLPATMGGSGLKQTGAQAFITLNTDYGDAPTTYGTESGTNAAYHQFADFNFDGFLGDTEKVYLGLLVDGESGGIPSGGAHSDDLNNLADDDGIVLTSLSATDTRYAIPAANIKVTNTTANEARLHAWVDFDGNGSFDADEYTSAVVSSGSKKVSLNQDLIWSSTPGLSDLFNGYPIYARFRLTTDVSLNASSATGAAITGEVEDYALVLNNTSYTVIDEHVLYVDGDLTSSAAIGAITGSASMPPSWSIAGGNDAGLFALDADGNLTAATEVSFDNQVSYVLAAVDANTTPSTFTKVTVIVRRLMLNLSQAYIDNEVAVSIDTLAENPEVKTSYQWQREGADIIGATSASYVATTDDLNSTLTLIGTYKDSAGNVLAILSANVFIAANSAAIDRIKTYADDQTQAVPTEVDYEAAGVNSADISADNLARVNQAIAEKTSSEVDTTAKLQAIVDAVIQAILAELAIDKIAAYAENNSAPAPTKDDYATAGITGVTAANLAEVNAAIDAVAGIDADSAAEIQAIVDQVNADIATAAAIDKIEAYADNNANSVPTKDDYATAGITGVTAANLAEVNAAIDAVAGIDADSAAEIQAIVDQVNASINALEALKEDLAGNADGTLITAAQLTDIRGIVGINADNISEYHDAFLAKPSYFADPENPTVEEINSVIDAVNDGGPDTDQDGLPDSIDKDDDNDGIPDTSESERDAVDACTPDNRHDECDFDNDGIKNVSDADDDGDGVADVNEPGEESNPHNDSDKDGISNINEVQAGTDPEDENDTPLDSDGDGTPDVTDKDDDNDGLLDVDESDEGRLNPDQDADGICDGDLAVEDVCTAGPDEDPINPDADGNGICDGIKAMPETESFKGCMPNVNSDADADTDNDGIKDTAEQPGDSDGDLIPDYLDPKGDGPAPAYGDSDNDGIDDKAECGPALPCRDSDKDGIYDYLDSDSDNDGISDDEEADGIANNGGEGTGVAKDSDGDGIPDYRDEDSDNDGTLDRNEVHQPHDPANPKDSDGDGIPDVVDHADGSDTHSGEAGGGDSDNDGLSDAEECPNYPTNCPDTDGDGVRDYLDNQNDSDGDGISDGDEDSNFDGDNNPSTNPRDTDGDGSPDYLDEDADNDGINDVDERDEPFDPNNPRDTDNDGIPDVIDADGSATDGSAGDSDKDGIADDIECTTSPCRDTDGDGIPDYADTDSDNDGIDDATEVGANPNQPQDTDGDGIPDIADKVNGRDGEKGGDSDGDGIADADECSSWPNCVDTDRDGIADYLDSDSSPLKTNLNPAPEVDLGTIKTGVHGAGSLSAAFIMMLAILVVWRRRSAKVIALPILFSSLAVNAAWWDEMDLYAGAGLGQSYLDPGIGGTQYSIDDHTQDAWKLSAGWDWNDHLSIEGYYSDLGRVSLKPGGQMGYRMVGGNAMLHYWARGGERVKGSIALYAKAGLNHMTNEGKGVSYESKSQGQLFGAIGAELYLPKKFSVRLEIDSYDADASLLTLNIVKRFGFKSRTPSLPPLPIVDKKDQQEEQFVAMVEELPVTAAGAKVIQLAPVVLDGDLDGLLDDEDECPYTPKGVSVNERGCATYNGKVGDLIANVQFEINSASLTEPSKMALDEIADMLVTYVAIKIEVQAHSDNRGSDSYNRKLSQKRADAVVKYLTQKQIAASRLTAVGFGEDNPVAGNSTAEGRTKNRRVEFILTDL